MQIHRFRFYLIEFGVLGGVLGVLGGVLGAPFGGSPLGPRKRDLYFSKTYVLLK